MNKKTEQRYGMIRRIGIGGFGEVWEVYDRHRETKAAMKRIDLSCPGGREAYETEKRMLAAQTERYFPVLFDSYTEEGDGVIIMEYLEGETLKELVKRQGPLPVETAVRYVRETADMLQFLHSLHPKLLYLDLKPENLIREPSGRLRLLDFGSVRAEGENREIPGGGILCTPGFSAPELFEHTGNTRPGIECDTYSLGVLLYYLLTGNSPDVPPHRVRDIRESDPSLSSLLSDFILKAASEDPKARYREVSDFQKALKEASVKKRFFERKVKNPLRILENVWKTNKLYPGLYAVLLFLFVFSAKSFAGEPGSRENGPIPEKGASFLAECVVPSDALGRHLLIKEGSVFAPEGDFSLTLPEGAYRKGRVYRVRVLVSDGYETREALYQIRYEGSEKLSR